MRARFGFHLSIRGGVLSAASEAARKNYRAFQLFVSNPRSWSVTHSPSEQATRFAESNSTHNIMAFAHMPYLCNLSSPRKNIAAKSIESAIENINECNALNVRYLVFHMGSHLGAGRSVGMANIIKALGSILDRSKHCDLLLENSAGYNNSMGSKINEMAEVLEAIDSKRLGICLDTCHLFAAGYDLRDEKAVARLDGEFMRLIGAKKLKLVHLNDSRFGLGSGLDRHWHIGRGYIGRAGFINVFKSKVLGNGPFIMETPYENERSEEMNLSAALNFYREANALE
ncbi:MAG: deoxyribonuclease IV [Candidatus Micrarchaeia archaeon]